MCTSNVQPPKTKLIMSRLVLRIPNRKIQKQLNTLTTDRKDIKLKQRGFYYGISEY